MNNKEKMEKWYEAHPEYKTRPISQEQCIELVKNHGKPCYCRDLCSCRSCSEKTRQECADIFDGKRTDSCSLFCQDCSFRQRCF